eukprot:282649-Pelagomonas_calceolata.AAC.1
MYANKLVTTRRAIENKNTTRSQVMEPAWWWRGALLSQCVSFSLIDGGGVSSAYPNFQVCSIWDGIQLALNTGSITRGSYQTPGEITGICQGEKSLSFVPSCAARNIIHCKD